MANLGDTKAISLTLLDGIIGDLNPKTTSAYNLGTSSLKWNNIYGVYFSGNAESANSVAWSGITGKPLTLTANATGFSISGGTTSRTLTVGANYTLGAACAKGVTDNSSNADVTSSD